MDIEALRTELEKYATEVDLSQYANATVLEIYARNQTGKTATYERIKTMLITPHYPKTVVFDFGGGRFKAAFTK